MPGSLLVTLGVEPAAQERLAAECAQHGGHPHVVLFRAVPAELEQQARVDLVQAAGPPFPVGLAGVLPLPGGVAYGIVSPELSRRHRELQQRWWEALDATDRRPLRAHVPVQRGATPVAARAAYTVLRRSFRPQQVRAEAFVLWREDWTELARIPFANSC